MTRVTAVWSTAAATALALAGCAPPHPHAHVATPYKTITRLDCPSSQEELTLKSAGPDGQSCLYQGPDGQEVTLQLIDLKGGDVEAALAPLTADLRSELPPTAGQAPSGDGGGEHDNVDIDLPGVHIHAHDNGESKSGARMAAGPTTASAEASGANASAETSHVEVDRGANVQIGGDKGVTIDAGDHGAEIRINKGGAGADLTFILASDVPGPHGYRFVSYEARGPEGGPLAVVSVKAPGEHGDNDELRREMGRLLRRNVGG
jgi:hypothetical protein